MYFTQLSCHTIRIVCCKFSLCDVKCTSFAEWLHHPHPPPIHPIPRHMHRSAPEARQVLSECKSEIMSDERFWGRVVSVVNLMKPFMKLLRKLDGDAPMIGKVYNECFKVRYP